MHEQNIRPFRMMPDQMSIVDNMNLLPYEDIVRNATTQNEARSNMLKAAIIAANGNKPEDQVDLVEAFLPIIENKIKKSIARACTHLGVRAAQGITKELQKTKAKRRKQLIFPVYKFNSFAGHNTLHQDAQNLYLIRNNPDTDYLLSTLKETFRGTSKAKDMTLSWQVCTVTDTEKLTNLRFRTKQACLVVSF